MSVPLKKKILALRRRLEWLEKRIAELAKTGRPAGYDQQEAAALRDAIAALEEKR